MRIENRWRKRNAILIISALLQGACMATVSNAAVPATIDLSDQDDKLKMQQAASELLFGRSVRFASTAFTLTNKVVIERVAAKDERGLIIEGRNTKNDAIELSLWLENQKCYLRRSDNDTSVLLVWAHCRAL